MDKVETDFVETQNIWLGLRKYLVRAKVYSLTRECGSPGCNKNRCQTCLNVENTDIFQSFVTKESYNINHKFDCDSKCMIYLFSCKAFGLQYVSYTVERLKTTKGRQHKVLLRHRVFFLQDFLSEGHHGLVSSIKWIPLEHFL